MESSVQVGGRVSDAELWNCDSCGVRMLTTERDVWCSGTAGVRTKIMTMRLCSRCYRLAPHLTVCCALYLLREGRTMPQLDEWLAKQAEPTFDLKKHILRQHGIVDKSEPEPEPYKPSKIIVPVGS